MLNRQIFFSADSPHTEKKVKSIDTCIVCYMYIYFLTVYLFVFNNYMLKRVHRSGLNFFAATHITPGFRKGYGR